VPCRYIAKFAVFAHALRVRAVQVASGDCRALQIAQEKVENRMAVITIVRGARTRGVFWRTQP